MNPGYGYNQPMNPMMNPMMPNMGMGMGMGMGQMYPTTMPQGFMGVPGCQKCGGSGWNAFKNRPCKRCLKFRNPGMYMSKKMYKH